MKEEDMASAVPAPGHRPDGSSQQAVSPVPASVPDVWLAINVEDPPAQHMVALYADGSGAQVLTKFDGDRNFYHADDGWALDPQLVAENYSAWCAAPADFRPHFMEVTPEDWR